MNIFKLMLALVVALGLLGLSSVRADDAQTGKPADKPIPYPLKFCIVSGDTLGEMGPPTVFIYKGHEIKFCCPSCKKDFLKDPDKYLKKIKEEAAKAAAAAKK